MLAMIRPENEAAEVRASGEERGRGKRRKEKRREKRERG